MSLLAGLPVQSSMLAAPSAAKRMFALIWAATKTGKTTIAAGLDAITQETLGKRTLIAACEKAQGAGLERVAHLDIPSVIIRSSPQRTALDALLAIVRDPTLPQQYGGLILDGLSELGTHDIRDQVLTMPSTASALKPLRDFGVFVEKDYEIFAEGIRKLTVALATLNDKGVHVIVTAGERVYSHREKGNPESVVDKIGPAFPGKGSIGIVETLVPTIFEVTQAYLKDAAGKPVLGADRRPKLGAFLETTRDGVRLRGDRTGLFPERALAIVEDDQGRPVSNLPAIFREHWLPASEQSKPAA